MVGGSQINFLWSFVAVFINFPSIESSRKYAYIYIYISQSIRRMLILLTFENDDDFHIHHPIYNQCCKILHTFDFHHFSTRQLRPVRQIKHCFLIMSSSAKCEGVSPGEATVDIPSAPMHFLAVLGAFFAQNDGYIATKGGKDHKITIPEEVLWTRRHNALIWPIKSSSL